MPETNLLKRIFSPAPTPTTTPVSKVPPAAASVPVTVAEPPKRSFWEVHRKLYDLFWGERHGMDEDTHKAFEAKLPKDGTRDAVRKKLINLKFFSDLFGSEPERVEPEMSALMSGMAETAWGVTGGVDDGKFFDLMKADVARQRRMLVSARTAGTLRFPTWRGYDLWKAEEEKTHGPLGAKSPMYEAVYRQVKNQAEEESLVLGAVGEAVHGFSMGSFLPKPAPAPELRPGGQLVTKHGDAEREVGRVVDDTIEATDALGMSWLLKHSGGKPLYLKPRKVAEHTVFEGEPFVLPTSRDITSMMASLLLVRGAHGMGGMAFGGEESETAEGASGRERVGAGSAGGAGVQAPGGGFTPGAQGGGTGTGYGVMSPDVLENGFHAGMPGGSWVTPSSGAGAVMGAGTNGVMNAVGGGDGTSAGAQQPRVPGPEQKSIGEQPKADEDDDKDNDNDENEDGDTANSESLVPEMAGGPKTDEESGHAVPPGGGGMGNGGGGARSSFESQSPPVSTDNQGTPLPNQKQQKPGRPESERKLTSRPWSENEGVVRTVATVQQIEMHPDHGAAIAGDNAAADRMVKTLAPAENLEAVAARNPKARIAVVPSMRATNTPNTVASAYARHLKGNTPLEITDGITLRAVPPGPEASMLRRMAFHPQFHGHVEKGAEYVIVADQVGTGMTVAAFRHFIERNGGRVVEMRTLGTAENSSVGITPKTRDALIKKFEVEEGINPRLRANGFYGGEIGSLSEAEGREMLKYNTPREFEAALMQEAAIALASRGIKNPSWKELRAARGLVGWENLTLEDTEAITAYKSSITLKRKAKRNAAFLEGQINNQPIPRTFLPIGERGAESMRSQKRYFEVVHLKHLRDKDSEVMLLENLAHDLMQQTNGRPEDPHGTITMVSELPICSSCQGVVQMFQEFFPNIKINLRAKTETP